ncbi:MAG: RagB/SusD family nutrient uptake outer membrane protein [Bacteroidales bacterium]|nr:RagB/SusD family nutrient uptake outer membrane protein [Bacteroidales bacterium]MCF8404882.1 RagB/SusD family nutrient uptake outer membrane protein [Bacteroidales bacterium]
MKYTLKYTIAIAGIFLMMVSCLKDLDTVPIDPDAVTAASVYDDPASYKMVLAKLYAGLAVSGQQGPAGQGDISGIDEGFGQYLRGYWYMQELTTDEAVIAWNDQTIKDLHYQTWSPSDVFITAFYYRIFYQVAVCNEFIRETTDEKLDERGVSGELRTEIETFRAEARFLRALSYWHALDVFGNVPFVTEEDKVGAFFPEQINRPDLYSYIVGELVAIENQLVDAGQNEYARADKAAAWTLLAKVYLNAEVYTGTARNTECVTYCNKVINSGVYDLEADYKDIFRTDNDNSPEVIFPVAFDGIHTRTYGGTTFLVHAAVGGDMNPADFGIDDPWGGLRTTSAFVNKYADVTGETDSRAMFFTEGQNLEIEDMSLFTEGYAITKWRNLTSTGQQGSDIYYVDTDFPMFRLADVYLMYAEAVLRGGSGGDAGTAVGYINMLRQRAYGDNSGDIASGDLNLDLVLDERARELFWECHRRTDLVRFNYFTTSEYVWPWKGNVSNGVATDSKYNLMPIPSADLTANLNLSQNPGY